MSVHLNRKLAITLLFSLALLLALARPSSANALSPDSPSRRDHHNIHRMIKRRVANPDVARQLPSDGAIGAGANPPADSSSPSTPSSTPSSPSPSADQQPSSAAPSSSSSPSAVASSSAVSHFPFTWRCSGILITLNRTSHWRPVRAPARQLPPLLPPPLQPLPLRLPPMGPPRLPRILRHRRRRKIPR